MCPTETKSVHIIELALKSSPVPVSVQRKDLEAAEQTYRELRQSMEVQQPRLIELSCDKMTDKQITSIFNHLSNSNYFYFTRCIVLPSTR